MSLFPSQVKRVLFSVSWLLLTISMGIWWLHLGLRQAGLIADLKKTIGGTVAVAGFDELHRQSRMLRLEGGFFILLLIAGGVTLLWLSYKDDERSKVLKDFFATV
ncbi:MAG: sensor histidine kinase, partial [Leptospiraceae bacterium]|nr:sensor histidine kinase [Leptospiraceae bacterium]